MNYDSYSISDLTKGFFSGLANLYADSYEHRPQQVDMSLAIAESLASSKNLCVEAPTGVGKSIAYLVPSLLLSLRENLPVVISTHTKALQGQIIANDIPIIESVISIPVRAVTLKGRSNYLCLRRLAIASARLESGGKDKDDNDNDAEMLANLRAYALHLAERDAITDKDTLPFPVRKELFDRVCSDHTCIARSCPFHKRCHVRKSRALAESAHVVIVNHALLLSSLKINEGANDSDDDAFTHFTSAIIPEHCAVIIDEAHTLADVASSCLGESTSSAIINSLLHELANARDENNAEPALRHEKLINDHRDAELSRAVNRATTQTRLFFERMSTHLHELLTLQREPEPRVIRQAVTKSLFPTLAMLLAQLASAIKQQHSSHSASTSATESLKSIHLRLHDALRALSLFSITDADHIARANFSQSLHACHCDTALNTPTNVNFKAPLLDPATQIKRLLLPLTTRSITIARAAPVVFTSATLAVNHDMTYFQRQIEGAGLFESDFVTSSLVLSTPFDYAKLVKVYIAQNAPPPARAKEHMDFLCEQIPRFLRHTCGGGWVLFTSHDAMNECADRLAPLLSQERMPLVTQDRDTSPADLIKRFRAQRGSVLFAVASFWTGVDVPGDDLRNVIITRLPFSSPADPLVAARFRHFANQSRDPFSELYIPSAVIRFRQGFGRLVRRRNDRGIVVILDSRIIRRQYGKEFLSSLPPCPVELF